VSTIDIGGDTETIIVVASDGVWTVMDNEEVARVVTTAPSLQQVCHLFSSISPSNSSSSCHMICLSLVGLSIVAEYM
jgi:serine/threonine protein phosphatase PrpC